jgi:hypothetical protein
MNAPVPPPDWYPDPANSGGWRYWNGQGWTQDVSNERPVAPGGFPPPGQASAPGYYFGAVPIRQSTNGFAVASMVLGILWIYWIGSILALVFGYIAKKQIRESNGTQGGQGMATAGIVLGWIGVGIIVLSVLIIVIGRSSNN